MKKLFLLLAAVTISLTLTACGGNEPTTLVISSSFAREVTELEIYQKEIFEQFEEDNNVKIEFTAFSEVGALFDKIDTEQKADEVVTDVLIAHYSDMVNFIEENDYMVSLNDLEDSMTGRTFSTSFDTSTNANGNRYFFPINTDVYLSIARNEAFDYLPSGLTEADVLAGDYTWDQFVEWCDGTNVKTAIKGQAGKLIIYQVGGMALAHTDTVAGTFPNVNSAANQRAWKQILEMKNNGAIHAQSSTITSAQELLESGAIQVAFEHLSVVGLTYDGAPAQFKVFPGPKGDSGKAGTIAGGHGVGVVKGSPNQELAEKFVEWMTAPEQIVHAALGSIPPLEEATAALGTSPADEVIKQGINTIANSNVEGLQMIPDYTEWGAVKGVSDAIFAEIMDGTITTEAQLLAKLAAQQTALEALKK
jgi:multiple sugar transport system substrate-binding protein